MKKNVSKTDAVIRLLLAVVLLSLYFTRIVDGVLGTTFLIFGVILAGTGLTNRCLIYLPFGLSTCKTK